MMKKLLIFFVVLYLIFSFAGCVQNKHNNTAGDVFRETYTGVVTDHFTEGSGSEIECLKVNISENITKVFTFINSTEISGTNNISIGDMVKIECESYTNSDYHPIIKITVLPLKSDLISVVMVNDVLYYDTGRESIIDERCGNMDGEITSTVEESKIPTENNQSNFGSGYGYQYGEKGTIEVYMNDKWVIFEQRWVEYTFDDSGRDVKFSVEYPNGWEMTEQRGYDGNENQEASPSTGISFTFFDNDEEMFSIMAVSFFPFEVDEDLFETELFETSDGLAGIKCIREIDSRVLAYYIFGNGETLPQYFAAINMSTENYEIKKNDIEAVMKTLKILAD